MYCVKLLVFEWQVDDPQIELICKVYNINPGNNTEIMEKCPTLREYTYIRTRGTF